MCHAAIKLQPKVWEATLDLREDKSRSIYQLPDIVEATPTVGIYCGFYGPYSTGSGGHYYQASLTPKWVKAPRISVEWGENYPVFPKWIWERLDGFDEEFLGWGGNKIEFTRRLYALVSEGLLDAVLITSFLARHQPHTPSSEAMDKYQGQSRPTPEDVETAKFLMDNREANHIREARVYREIRNKVPWWRDKVALIEKALHKQASWKPETISVVIGTFSGGVHLLRQTLLALSKQDLPKHLYEIVVAIDGGDPSGLVRKAAEFSNGGPLIKIVESPRPHGNIPHRNHARNMGARAATGDLLFFIDNDFLLPPHALSHILTTHRRASANGRMVLTSVCLGALDMSPQSWLDEIAKVPSNTPVLPHNFPHCGGIYSGYIHEYVESSTASWIPRNNIKEGYPTLPRWLWRSLGGFDEAYLGWGGDKVDFVDRCKGLSKEGLLDIFLVRSVLALHQPHPVDVEAFTEGRLERCPALRKATVVSVSKELSERRKKTRKKNEFLHNQKKAGIMMGAIWWRNLVYRVCLEKPGV
jgi:glycosyltransferase involved in cell wall biosynthesis